MEYEPLGLEPFDFSDYPETREFEPVGEHVILDLYNVDPKLLRDVHKIESYMIHGAEVSGAHILNTFFHHFGEDYGVTGIVAVSESHLSIHTWPEKSYAAIDIFFCGDCDPFKTAKYLLDSFKATHYNISKIERG